MGYLLSIYIHLPPYPPSLLVSGYQDLGSWSIVPTVHAGNRILSGPAGRDNQGGVSAPCLVPLARFTVCGKVIHVVLLSYPRAPRGSRMGVAMKREISGLGRTHK